MEVKKLFGGKYNGKRVLITGHTGFKGSWLSTWLLKLGAKVLGISDKVPTNPSHFDLLNLDQELESTLIDIRDFKRLKEKIIEFAPEIVFHLAAQPLVRYSYINPIETFETNVIGTVNLLEACRNKSVKGILIVTSDKCYENLEESRPFVEEDRMGGYDPYSCSKGVAELITSSYRNSYFNLKEYGIKHDTLISSCRAGNVIGGGDWAEDRLIPDIIRSISNGEEVLIRSPKATRPWQHVLEPLSGYLLLGQKLLESEVSFSGGWNFGPKNNEVLTVEEVLGCAKSNWNSIQYSLNKSSENLYEAKFLSLNCDKAKTQLHWEPVWDTKASIEKTVEWYKQLNEGGKLITIAQLEEYVSNAKKQNQPWVS